MTQEADTGLFDAITAGIESAGPTPATSETSDDSSDNDSVEASAEQEGTSVEETDSGESEESSENADGEVGDDAPETEGESKGEQPDPTAEAKDVKKVDDKAAQPPAKDAVNDPLPNALKKETKERIQSLISTVKEKDAILQKVQGERDEFISMVTETGATPQQYGDALNYLALVNSGDPVKQEQALQIMQGEIAALAKMLGKPVAGVDMLSEHPDLQQAVRDNLLLQEHAEEMAAARTRNKLQVNQSTQRAQVQQTQQQNNAAAQQGREALNQIGEQLRAKDRDYDRKREILVPALKPVLATAHPSQWAAIWQSAYDNLKLPSVQRTSTVQGQQPLRGKNPSGGAAKAPASMADAISEAITMAGHR